MWESAGERLALLELLVRGTLRCRRAQRETFTALQELPWTRATGRRDEIAVVEERRPELVALLERAWPEWREALAELTARGLPPTHDGWSRLLDAERAAGLPDLPPQLNRRTAAALTGPHSKSLLTRDRLAALGATEATHDGTVRLRPPGRLIARNPSGEVDLAAVASVLGEVAIAERAFRGGLELEGDVRSVLLVENLGAWRDLPAAEGCLLAHVPGWDTVAAGHLLQRFAHVPAVHFGDLDPNGVRIYLHLREKRPSLGWFLPSFWRERIDDGALCAPWPSDLPLDEVPALVRDLAARGLWLEQELIVLDPRLPEDLSRTLRGLPPRA